MSEAKTNNELITQLIELGDLYTPAIITAFKIVDRINFVPLSSRKEAYGNYPLSIGEGQTVSQPSTVAFMLEQLKVQKGQNVLEVGVGCGWVSALLACLVGEKGRVFGLEIISKLAEQAHRNISKYDFKNLQLILADGSCGYKKFAPYDRIIVSAAARILSPQLKEQLTDSGRIVAPVGDYPQDIVLIERKGGSFVEQRFPGFVFVPLITK